MSDIFFEIFDFEKIAHQRTAHALSWDAVIGFELDDIVVDEICDWNAQNSRCFDQQKQTDLIGSAFVFLDLLKGDAQRVTKLLLRHPANRALLAELRSKSLIKMDGFWLHLLPLLMRSTHLQGTSLAGARYDIVWIAPA